MKILRCLALSLAALLAAPAMAQAPISSEEDAGKHAHAAAAAQRKAEHERIRHEREALKAQQVKEEAACYQRFAVEDCLRAVRARGRDAEGRLRTQEIMLNDAERKEKAADRLKAIEEKQQRPAPAEAKGPDAVLRKPPATQAQRDHDAALRAEQQRSRVQKQADEQARRAADSAERAVQARTRHAETIKAAEERRARVEKARADAAAQGRKPAAPLPAGSDAR